MADASTLCTDIYTHLPVTTHVKLIAPLVMALSGRLQVEMTRTHVHIEHCVVERHAHTSIWLTLTIQYAYSELIVAKVVWCHIEGEHKLFVGRLHGCRKGT